MLITIDSNVDNMAKLIADKLLLPAKLWCTSLNRCPSIVDVKKFTKSSSRIQSNSQQLSSTSTQVSNTVAKSPRNDDTSNQLCPRQITKHAQTRQIPPTPPPKPAKKTSVNNASKKFNRRYIFYNTPISLADDISMYNFNMEQDGMFFVYLDKTKQDLAYERIIKNISVLTNAVIIINNKSNVDDLNLPHVPSYIINTGNCGSRDVSDIISTIISTHMLVGRQVHQRELIAICYPQRDRFNIAKPNEETLALNQSRPKPIMYNIYEVMGVDDSQTEQQPEVDNCHECH